MVQHRLLVGLLVFQLFFEIAQLALQALIILLQLQLVRFQFNILRDHLLDALLRASIQCFIEEVNPHLEVKVLLGKTVNGATLLFERHGAAAPGKGRRGARPLFRRQSTATIILPELLHKCAGHLNIFDTFRKDRVRRKSGVLGFRPWCHWSRSIIGMRLLLRALL